MSWAVGSRIHFPPFGFLITGYATAGDTTGPNPARLRPRPEAASAAGAAIDRFRVTPVPAGSRRPTVRRVAARLVRPRAPAAGVPRQPELSGLGLAPRPRRVGARGRGARRVRVAAPEPGARGD